MDGFIYVGTYDLSGTKIMPVHPEHKKAAEAAFFCTSTIIIFSN
jgi:hypothetical protein